ncbi:serine/threonine protein kinase [Nostoc sp. HG1]|nr:serine/threonine protein kinase [Nostoc sp. HG1]
MTSQESADSNQEILLERYEVQQELGKKAGRRTFLARDLQTQELVVVKILSFGNEFEWNDLKLFEREAETLKALSHPAIPSYLDYFELDSPNSRRFALVQSYIPAKSLEAQLEAGRSFSEQEVKELAKAILEILKYLHGRQPPVIHRDIKPSNILLTNRSGNSVGEVYLVDFGSVQTIARISSTMTVVGTYGYMPPEQFNGRATPASDLYSLGATLIYLVTGQHPGDLPQIDLQIEFEQVANISSGFRIWLRQMTEPIASKRLTSAEDALQALEQPGNATQTQRKATILTVSTVEKPPGSKVVLNKNVNFIEIIIPAISSWKKLIIASLGYSFFVLVYLFMPLFLIAWISHLDSFTIFLLALVLLATILYNILPALFGEMRLRITRQQISRTFNLFGIELYSRLPSLKQNISQLERTEFGIDNRCLIIWAGRRNYKIYSSYFARFSVTTPELNWLTHELSDWLGLPITKE